jgi:1-acyl-sn-glycerol-3-phosphate acyltransferase
MVHSLKACWRLLHAVGHALGGWWTIRFTFPGLSQQERNLRVQQWSRRLLEIMGVTLKVQGTPPEDGPVLLICNHHAACHVRFVSKSGVKHWPLIGTLSTGAGSLYIERERRRDAMRVVHHMTEALQGGDRIGVFPEGTTSDGNGLLPFHANLLQAAISSGAPVLPAALRFADAATGQTSQAPRYIDDDNLLTSLWNTLRAPPLLAIVRFGEPQSSLGRERRAWALALREDVQQLHHDTH